MRNVLIAIIVILLFLTILFSSFIFQQKKQEIPKNQTIPQAEKSKIYEIFIFSDKFEPSQLTINSGEKVKWINKDNKQHELLCLDSTRETLFDVIILPGENFSWSFYSKGKYEFWSPEIGEKMKGNIIVE
jgi:plastocyanin